MSFAGDAPYVDRRPPQTPAMREAYAGLADAERAVSEAHAYGYATDDWQPHHEAITTLIEWHAEIGRVAQEQRR